MTALEALRACGRPRFFGAFLSTRGDGPDQVSVDSLSRQVGSSALCFGVFLFNGLRSSQHAGDLLCKSYAAHYRERTEKLMASKSVNIFYSTDLIHLPMRCDRDKIQRLYNDMSHKLYGGYQNLAFNYGNIEMFTVYANHGSSRFQLLPDRFRVMEQNSGIKLADFMASC